jgi:cellulose synthase/poly-beta-1,6-N-acetylglucosamine synthase-like glycosyltransferase
MDGGVRVKDYLIPRLRGLRMHREETYAPNLAGSLRYELSPHAIHDTQISKLSISIGICAYNEEANISKLLESLQLQKSDQIEISQIVVISTACTDRTDELVEFYQRNDPRIELIRQAERKGKASAINLFLHRAKGDICVLQSADTIAQENAIECLCLPFCDGKIGMTGGGVIPVDDPSKFMGFVTHLIWNLAHQVSVIEPKLGELVAFRNIINKIPEDTAVDEACIEAIMKERGYRIKYVPEAHVYNKGTESMRDFIKQRRRIYAGHLHLKKVSGYRVSSMNFARLLKLVFRSLKPNLKSILWTLAGVALECYARFLGTYDFYVRKRNPYIWDIALSTKRLADD